MDPLDEQITELFKIVMKHCRQERKAKTKVTIRTLAQRLHKTENFISSVENGREFPSLRTFLGYLILLGFDTSGLTRLFIDNPQDMTESGRMKSTLIKQIYALDDDQVEFLVEQSKVMQNYRVKRPKE